MRSSDAPPPPRPAALFGPPAIGLLARHLGLHNALWLVGALSLLVVVLASATREPARDAVLDPEGHAAAREHASKRIRRR